MPGSSPYRTALDKIAARLRQRNSIYLALSLIARVINAAGMFVAIKRFAPSTFGEMSYLTATAVSTVAFCSFGIEISINAQLTRKLKESVSLTPTILAGCALALAGTILACIVICAVFASQLRLSSSPGLAVLTVCVYSSFMISTSLLTAMSFALGASVNVGISYMATSLIFAGFAVFANPGTSGVDLMFFLICAQVVAVSYMAIALVMDYAKAGHRRADGGERRHLLPEAWRETKTLFSYGAKQILVVSALTFSQWLIQRKIVFGNGGTSENAIYSIGNQIFNMMTFIPLIITPIIITKLAAAHGDMAQRRSISLQSLRLFTTISICACVGGVYRIAARRAIFAAPLFGRGRDGTDCGDRSSLSNRQVAVFPVLPVRIEGVARDCQRHRRRRIHDRCHVTLHPAQSQSGHHHQIAGLRTPSGHFSELVSVGDSPPAIHPSGRVAVAEEFVDQIQVGLQIVVVELRNIRFACHVGG